MAKEKEAKEIAQEAVVEEQKAAEPKKETEKAKEVKASAECWLKSKANYIIEVKDNGQSKFIQPFGKVKINKEKLEFVNDADAYQVAFVKA